jgi:kynurenine formamidase
MRLVELSHEISHGMVTVPNLPPPVIDEYLTREASRDRYAPGTEFSIGRITMVANTGTYLDAPFHRFSDGADLAGLAIEAMAELDGVVVGLADERPRPIEIADLSAVEPSGKAVLLHTGWDRHWGTPAYGNGRHPFLTRNAADWLVARGVRLVGIDSQNIDDTGDPSRPAHTTLLRAGIPIVEHLTGLEQLPPDGFVFSAVAPRVMGMGTWPVRALARIG